MVPPASALAVAALRHREHLTAAEQARRFPLNGTPPPGTATVLAAWRHASGAALVRFGGRLLGAHRVRVVRPRLAED